MTAYPKYFGQNRGTPAHRDAEHTPTPVGVRCAYCEEGIVEGDDGWLIPGMLPDETAVVMDGIAYYAFHYECHLRGIFGGVAHILKMCSCYWQGATETDPEGMTKREAAIAAVRTWERVNHVRT